MTQVQERNNEGRYYVNTRLAVAKTKNENDFPDFTESNPVYDLLTNLIEVNAKGFRGVVVTALTGMHLNPDYNPLENFYACNPRSIFEGGIWNALQENDIPCGKSDPLNVAKNVDLLNEDWARGRRPQSAALAAVEFLRIVVDATEPKKRARLIDYFFYRLWRFADSVNSYHIAEVTTSSSSKQYMGNTVIDFCLAYPESGTLPQLLVAELLSTVYQESEVNVIGGDESVFGTNTTSKKPADIWLELRGEEINLYEVTVKVIPKKRLDDSIDALQSTGHIEQPVTFICRIPEDVSELEVTGGRYIYKGKEFDFVDFKAFCSSMIALLKDEDFSLLLERMSHSVKDKHISLKTKQGWNEHFGSED